METGDYINKDLYGLELSEFSEQLSNDFIGDSFIEQLEWAMLLIQSKFKQMRLASYLPAVSANHFDRAYLMSSSLNDNQRFFTPFTDLQASPKLFPNINIKTLNISDTIQLLKLRELGLSDKRALKPKQKYVYEFSTAFYKKDTECFYGTKIGYELGERFFDIHNNIKNGTVLHSDLPRQISLNPNYFVPSDAWKYCDFNEVMDVSKTIAISYQIAMSMYYEWCMYIKENDNIGIVIPIDPCILSDIYKTSMLKIDNKKRMLHFVKDYYRRKPSIPKDDYSVYVHKYIRGEYRFDYRGFYAEIIPPRYDLNRARTSKKFVDNYA